MSPCLCWMRDSEDCIRTATCRDSLQLVTQVRRSPRRSFSRFEYSALVIRDRAQCDTRTLVGDSPLGVPSLYPGVLWFDPGHPRPPPPISAPQSSAPRFHRGPGPGRPLHTLRSRPTFYLPAQSFRNARALQDVPTASEVCWSIERSGSLGHPGGPWQPGHSLVPRAMPHIRQLGGDLAALAGTNAYPDETRTGDLDCAGEAASVLHDRVAGLEDGVGRRNVLFT